MIPESEKLLDEIAWYVACLEAVAFKRHPVTGLQEAEGGYRSAMSALASRLPRQEDEIRKAALEENMSGQPAPNRIWATGDGRNGSWVSEEPHDEWQTGAVEYVRALSQKGDEADG
jgi:hypothetical protein